MNSVGSARGRAHHGDGAVLLAVTGAGAFLAALCVLAARGTLPLAVPAVYLIASVATFIMYAVDKTAAKAGTWRTPETTLHVLAAIGGWPGALIAQKSLHHKSSKPSFQFVFWVTVVLNCAGLAWFSF